MNSKAVDIMSLMTADIDLSMLAEVKRAKHNWTSSTSTLKTIIKKDFCTTVNKVSKCRDETHVCNPCTLIEFQDKEVEKAFDEQNDKHVKAGEPGW